MVFYCFSQRVEKNKGKRENGKTFTCTFLELKYNINSYKLFIQIFQKQYSIVTCVFNNF